MPSIEQDKRQLHPPRKTWWTVITAITIAMAYWQLLSYFFWWPGLSALAGSCMESTPEGDHAEDLFLTFTITLPLLWYLVILIATPMCVVFSKGEKRWLVSLFSVIAGFIMTVVVCFNHMLDTID